MIRDVGKFVKTHQPCPCGSSSDGFQLRADGSGYCYGKECSGKNHRAPKGLDVGNNKEEETEDLQDYIDVGKMKFQFYPHRGLTEQTMRTYGIETKMIEGQPFEVMFPYPQRRGMKVRNYNEKKFHSVGDMKKPDLFGMDRFDPGSKESVTITAGEYDAPSIYQATGGKTAAVSLPSGAHGQGLQACVNNRDFLNSFKKIYLALDRDTNDQDLARQISQLFDFNKVYHVKFGKYKDANDYLQKAEGNDLLKIWENARRYSPDNIISQFDDIRKALSVAEEDQLGTWPWEQLNNMTYGLHAEEVVVVKGLEKIGKTEILRALAHHLLKTTDHNIGIIFLEENNATTIKGIAGYELDVPAMLPDVNLSVDDIIQGYKKAVGERDDRVHLYQSFESEDEQRFLDGVRFLAAGARCKFVLFDHITWLATGSGDDDERKKLDRISQKLKLLAKELGICIVMISHVNDNGQTRGSRNITKVANTILHVERDKAHADATIRNTTYFSLEGVRLGGQSGPAGHVVMDRMTGKLRETRDEDDYRIPQK